MEEAGLRLRLLAAVCWRHSSLSPGDKEEVSVTSRGCHNRRRSARPLQVHATIYITAVRPSQLEEVFGGKLPEKKNPSTLELNNNNNNNSSDGLFSLSLSLFLSLPEPITSYNHWPFLVQGFIPLAHGATDRHCSSSHGTVHVRLKMLFNYGERLVLFPSYRLSEYV